MTLGMSFSWKNSYVKTNQAAVKMGLLSFLPWVNFSGLETTQHGNRMVRTETVMVSAGLTGSCCRVVDLQQTLWEMLTRCFREESLWVQRKRWRLTDAIFRVSWIKHELFHSFGKVLDPFEDAATFSCWNSALGGNRVHSLNKGTQETYNIFC